MGWVRPPVSTADSTRLPPTGWCALAATIHAIVANEVADSGLCDVYLRSLSWVIYSDREPWRKRPTIKTTDIIEYKWWKDTLLVYLLTKSLAIDYLNRKYWGCSVMSFKLRLLGRAVGKPWGKKFVSSGVGLFPSPSLHPGPPPLDDLCCGDAYL